MLLLSNAWSIDIVPDKLGGSLPLLDKIMFPENIPAIFCHPTNNPLIVSGSEDDRGHKESL